MQNEISKYLQQNHVKAAVPRMILLSQAATFNNTATLLTLFEINENIYVIGLGLHQFVTPLNIKKTPIIVKLILFIDVEV